MTKEVGMALEWKTRELNGLPFLLTACVFSKKSLDLSELWLTRWSMGETVQGQ